MSEWIKVTTNLPDRDDTLCIVSNGRYVCVMTFYDGYFFPGELPDLSITHWMPFPPPPEVK